MKLRGNHTKDDLKVISPNPGMGDEERMQGEVISREGMNRRGNAKQEGEGDPQSEFFTHNPHLQLVVVINRITVFY